MLDGSEQKYSFRYSDDAGTGTSSIKKNFYQYRFTYTKVPVPEQINTKTNIVIRRLKMFAQFFPSMFYCVKFFPCTVYWKHYSVYAFIVC